MDKIIKPFLPKDVVEEKLTFPLAVLPKIDGSFAMVANGKLYARSLKHHENLFVTEQYSKPEYEGLRGEMCVGDSPTDPHLCRKTSSALRRIEGEPVTTFMCFDYVTHETQHLSYKDRHKILVEKVRALNLPNIVYIPYYIVSSLEEYRSLRDMWMDMGYEGVVVRDLDYPHKEGRSSAVKPHLWRWKPWDTAEIRVTVIEEGTTNLNEATIDELGHTKRSTHQENMKLSGIVGTIIGALLSDLKDFHGNVVAVAGTEVRVSPGEMTAKEREYYFLHQDEILGHIVEFSFMNFGLKDRPRFAQFKRIRSPNDL